MLLVELAEEETYVETTNTAVIAYAIQRYLEIVFANWYRNL